MNANPTPNTLLSEIAAAARSYFQSTPELSAGLEAKLKALLDRAPTNAPYQHPIGMGDFALTEANHRETDTKRGGQLYLLTKIFVTLVRIANALEPKTTI